MKHWSKFFMVVNLNYLLAEQNSARINMRVFLPNSNQFCGIFSHDSLFCHKWQEKTKTEFYNNLYKNNIDGRKTSISKENIVSGGQGRGKHWSSSLCL